MPSYRTYVKDSLNQREVGTTRADHVIIIQANGPINEVARNKCPSCGHDVDRPHDFGRQCLPARAVLGPKGTVTWRYARISIHPTTTETDASHSNGVGNKGGMAGHAAPDDTTAGGSPATRNFVPDGSGSNGAEHRPSTRKLPGGSSASPTAVHPTSGWC